MAAVGFDIHEKEDAFFTVLEGKAEASAWKL